MTEHRPGLRPTWRTDPLRLKRRQAIFGLAAGVGGIWTASRANAQAPQTCVFTPDSGEGPFYFDPSLVRTDIRDGQAGAPLSLDIQVLRERDCAALENARFDLWHADSLGRYSGYARQNGVGGVSMDPIDDAKYLRGTQFTDADGRVQFRTIHPSWYRGRTPHLHFKVFLGNAEIVASQIFIPDDINDRVFSQWEPYRTHISKRDTDNSTDSFLRGSIGGVFCDADINNNEVHANAVITIRDE